jgi:hypothetical protein
VYYGQSADAITVYCMGLHASLRKNVRSHTLAAAALAAAENTHQGSQFIYLDHFSPKTNQTCPHIYTHQGETQRNSWFFNMHMYLSALHARTHARQLLSNSNSVRPDIRARLYCCCSLASERTACRLPKRTFKINNLRRNRYHLRANVRRRRMFPSSPSC